MNRDLKLALRAIRRSPIFTITVVLTLALGIGAATAIFSVADAVLFEGLPYREPDRIVRLGETSELEPDSMSEFSWPDYLDLKETDGIFESIAGYGYVGGLRVDTDEGPTRFSGASVTPGFFSVLGVSPVAGRTFLPEEGETGAPRVALVSHSMWQSYYGGADDVVGSTVMIENTPFEIVGILPENFHFAPGGSADVWTAKVPSPFQAESRFLHWIKPVARLAPGVSIEAARSALDPIVSRFHKPDASGRLATIAIVPIKEKIIGRMGTIVAALLCAAGIVFLIAIVNVTNLTIARASDRTNEIATRSALGGTRAQIARPFFAESLLYGLFGAFGGLVLARMGTVALIDAIPSEIRAAMPFLEQVGVDGRVVVFVVLATMVTSVFVGLTTAGQAVHAMDLSVLRSGKRISGASGRLRRTLVVAEAGLSLTLVIATGLLMRSASTLDSVDTGFDRNNLLTLTIELPNDSYENADQNLAFYERAIERVNAVPGVAAAALVDKLPMTGFGNTGGPVVEGRPAPAESISANLRGVTPEYFEAMGLSTVGGRIFSRDEGPDRGLVAVVSESLARRLLPNEDLVGQRVRFVFLDDPVEVIGVVRDENVGSLDADPEPVMYFSYYQDSGSNMSMVVRTAVDPKSVAPQVTGEIRSIEPRALIHSVQSMNQLVDSSLAIFLRQYPLKLIGSFGVVALILASIGIYGVIAYSVSQQTRELGIRMALGATRARLLRLVVGQASTLGVIGVLVGLALAVPLTRLMSNLLFRVGAFDPGTWIGSSAILLAVTVGASLIPAFRAARTAPGEALRYE